MTFGDPVDITMFAQRKFVNSVLPCVNRQNFKEKWMKHTQLSARVWSGIVIDYLTMVLLANIYDWTLPNWTLGWKMVTGVCVCADAVLLLSLGIPLVAKYKLCPLRLKNMNETTESACRCDLFVFEFAAFKTMSLLHAMFIVAQGLVNAPDNLTYHRNNVRLVVSVIAIIDIALNSVEMFASGCFWCVCCIHSTEVSPEAEAMSQTEVRYTESPAEAEAVFSIGSSSQMTDSSNNNNNSSRSDEVQSVYINHSHPLSEV